LLQLEEMLWISAKNLYMLMHVCKVLENQAIFTLIAWSAVPVQSTARCTTDSVLAFRLEAVL
jgi:hypothetical protein